MENGFSPQDIQSAYGLPSSTAGEGQTIAIVDAYDDPYAEQDLAVYRETYGLPPCTTANGCFTKVDQRGGQEYPEASSQWALEISLDLDMVSAACPKCHILLVEGDSPFLDDLAAAVEQAVALGADAVSNSYLAREAELGESLVNEFRGAYEQPGIPVTVASGDWGYSNVQNAKYNEKDECLNCGPSFPASVAPVIAVGGTTLQPEGTSGRGWKENTWIYSGSACALYIAKPAWQKDSGCSKRTSNDVAAVAGGETSLSVYDTMPPYSGWVNVEGTSASTPIVAAVSALQSPTLRAEGVQGIYSHPENWRDVISGSNWWKLGEVSYPYEACSSARLCIAASGYDAPTGFGTPNGGATATPPSAITLQAQEVTTAKATLTGVVNPERSTTTYWFEYGTTRFYGGKSPASGGTVSGYTKPSKLTTEINGLSSLTQYHYRIVAQSAGGTTYGSDRVLSTGPKVHNFNYSLTDESKGALKNPADVAVDPLGNTWVADTGNDRIVEFAPDGSFIQACGRSGSGTPAKTPEDPWQTDLQFKEPAGIAIDPQSASTIYVVDRGNNRVQVFTSPPDEPQYQQGCYFATAFGSAGSAPGQLSEPEGIVFGQAPGYLLEEGPGELLVADKGNNRIQVFEPWKTGAYEVGDHLSAYGSVGSGNGQFSGPTDIGRDPANPGQYYVVDSGNNRIEKIKSTWTYSTKTLSFSYLSQFGSKGSGNGSFEHPTAIDSDPTTGDLLVTDTGNNRVQEFLPGGTYVGQFGSAGSGASAFSSPRGLIVDSVGAVSVADRENSRIDVWGPTVTSNAPYAATQAAIDVKANQATLNAIVNPEGLATAYYFEYGPTTSYGTKVPVSPASAGSGTSNVAVAQIPTDLFHETTYHYRVVAESAAGTTKGVDKTVTTLKGAKAVTEAASNVKTTEATLNGTVNPEGAATSYWFEYGTTTSYGTKIPVSPASAGSGSSDVAVSQTPSGLAQGTTYHYRVVAEGPVGKTFGADKTLTTLKLPVATTEAAMIVNSTKATLNGTVNPEGSATSYYFEYGLNPKYGTKIPVSPASVGSGTSNVAVSQTPAGLTPSTTYHFRVVAESAAGTAKGADKAFTTPSAIRWYGCQKQAGGKYTNSECSKEGSPNEWESVLLKAGEKTTAVGQSGTIVFSGTAANLTGTLTCETEVNSVSLQNPASGGDGLGGAEIKYKGCKTGGNWEGCSATMSASSPSTLELVLIEGKTEVWVKPETSNFASFTFSGCKSSGLNKTFPLSGSAYGVYSNAASRIEFSAATTEAVLKFAGVKATATGSIGLRTSAGGYVKAG